MKAYIQSSPWMPPHTTSQKALTCMLVMQLADDSPLNDLIAANRDAKTLGQLLSFLILLSFFLFLSFISAISCSVMLLFWYVFYAVYWFYAYTFSFTAFDAIVRMLTCPSQPASGYNTGALWHTSPVLTCIVIVTSLYLILITSLIIYMAHTHESLHSEQHMNAPTHNAAESTNMYACDAAGGRQGFERSHRRQSRRQNTGSVAFLLDIALSFFSFLFFISAFSN